MTWTPATFAAAYPEFAPTLAADTSGSRTVVQTALTNAAAQCDSRLFPDDLDHAVGLLAAHLLSIAPYGQQARQDTGNKKRQDETTYLAEWKRLVASRAGGPWTIGQPAVAPTILPGGWNPWGCP